MGDTKLTFALFSSDGDEVISAPVDLQVFAPLKLYPRNTTLLIGSVLQLSVKGGPQPDNRIEFVVNNDNVAGIIIIIINISFLGFF